MGRTFLLLALLSLTAACTGAEGSARAAVDSLTVRRGAGRLDSAARGLAPHASGSPSLSAMPDIPTTALPDGTRLVHIGPYKTGTTAIQAAFHLARKSALAQGVHYAGYGRQPMQAVMAGIGKPSPWAATRKPPNRAVWRQLVGEIRGSSARHSPSRATGTACV